MRATVPTAPTRHFDEIGTLRATKVLLYVDISTGAHGAIRIKGKHDTQIHWGLICCRLSESHENVDVPIAIDTCVGWQADPDTGWQFAIVHELEILVQAKVHGPGAGFFSLAIETSFTLGER